MTGNRLETVRGRGPVKSFLLMILAPVLIIVLPAQAAHDDKLTFKSSDPGRLSIADLVKDLDDAKVVTIGEQHDDRLHHEVQLKVINALHSAGRDIAVGFEQFGARSQNTLDRWVAGKADIEELFHAYSRDWEITWWSLYLPVFQYAREHEIPMIGLNIPREIVNQVAREGFSSLSAEQRGKIRVLSCNIDQKYQEILRRVLGHEGQGNHGRMFNKFCEAQVVWDTSMALNAIDYMDDNPRKTLVILAGNFHAWKRGIPEQIRRASDFPVRSILPSQDSSFYNYSVFLEDADYVWRLE
ncbi:MAG: ChaN family lipoprotein [Pseudomonadota bacterium]|jgi:uncharacterized iron-regulated protein